MPRTQDLFFGSVTRSNSHTLSVDRINSIYIIFFILIVIYLFLFFNREFTSRKGSFTEGTRVTNDLAIRG